MKFQWVKAHQDQFPVNSMCDLLEISRSGYYDWVDRPASSRQTRREELLEAIRVEYQAGREVSGSPRIHQALVARGIDVCLNTVATLMNQAEIRSKRCKRFRVQTTDSNHDHRIAENLLDQRFVADRPDQIWLCDITYVPTREGPLFLASVLDVFSRKIVGWQMADHLRAELCVDALSMAIRSRAPGQELVHHSDRGVQYACDTYKEVLKTHGITASMSRRGNCYDNAMMESFHASYKCECVYQRKGKQFADREEGRRMTFEWIEVFYNRQRRHSAIGYLSPETFEASLN